MYFSVLQLHVHEVTYDIAPQRSTKVYYMFDRPKPRYVVTEFHLTSRWRGVLPAAILSPVYFQKIKRWRFTSSVNYCTLFSLPHFLNYENARNAVSGNPNFLKFSRGSMPPDPPRDCTFKTHTHPSTKNPDYAPDITLTEKKLKLEEESTLAKKHLIQYIRSLNKTPETSSCYGV